MPDLRTFICSALFRPTQLLFTEPLVIATPLMSDFSFATEARQPFCSTIGFSETVCSLPFLSGSIGCWFSIFPRFIDYQIFAAR
ncbi:hypothetical protein EYZ11_005783 [Aspergillus tanneri]|uniref:Uncharacterized protein n=1 Tax=Aspergillus tanneri TaxID=1220188 RepID=A0A4V6RQU2_9EURO|nr:hypothetical protein EYZ11_005783 [Aspergillus tanneri]